MGLCLRDHHLHHALIQRRLLQLLPSLPFPPSTQRISRTRRALVTLPPLYLRHALGMLMTTPSGVGTRTILTDSTLAGALKTTELITTSQPRHQIRAWRHRCSGNSLLITQTSIEIRVIRIHPLLERWATMRYSRSYRSLYRRTLARGRRPARCKRLPICQHVPHRAADVSFRHRLRFRRCFKLIFVHCRCSGPHTLVAITLSGFGLLTFVIRNIP